MAQPELEVGGIGIRDTAGQKEVIEPEREKEIPKAELKDGDNEVEIATGYNPRMPAVEIDPGRPIIPNIAAMVKQEYASNAENGEMDHRRPAMRKVLSSVSRIVDSIALHALTMLLIKSLLQKLARTGLE